MTPSSIDQDAVIHRSRCVSYILKQMFRSLKTFPSSATVTVTGASSGSNPFITPSSVSIMSYSIGTTIGNITFQKCSFASRTTPQKTSKKLLNKGKTASLKKSTPSPPLAYSFSSSSGLQSSPQAPPARQWPARTAQGYKCKQCTSLGRGHYCELHKEPKNVQLINDPTQAKSSNSSITRFAKENPSLTLAALCVLQQIADSPIAQ